ncbi:hypothetical protein V5P93_006721 [Actinokineospora auranticolor]|uniref:Uncharacterized protein n=1 Tax=Actinokineospora auranticolor TaxID=155976 RepID=A0A2S6GWL2_9PSEU|nr:hypothetical protein [Actinokineospora auranticolor]PPK69635.1 hypothetical protein CLV40_103245 [Actinokineospora auranticolor]
MASSPDPEFPGADDQGRHRVDGRPRRARRGGAHSLEGAARAAGDTDVLPVVGPTVHVDGPATGLAKFDLGTIPASVTPPVSWRRAAWFAVASAILVVFGLTYAAVTLMTGPRRPDVIDALPGLPGMPSRLPEPLVDGQGGTPSAAPRPGGAPSSGAPAPTSAPESPGPDAGDGDQTSESSADGSPVTTTRVAAAGPGDYFNGGSVPAPQVTAAPRSTVVTPMLVVPPNDPNTMGDRTEAFYRAMPGDPGAAYALTTGHLRREGQEQLRRHYADVVRVDVVRIVVDPSRARTKALLRLVRRDGSVTTEERELTFTFGADPRISAERATP